MAEYNKKYLELKNRLSILKLRISGKSLPSEQKKSLLSCVDNLLKLLDERYSENLHLEIVESEVKKLELIIN